MKYRPKLRDALTAACLVGLVAAVVMFAHRGPAAPLTTSVIDVRESIGRYDQDLSMQVSVSARTGFLRQHSPARWAQAEAFASLIDARLQADPAMAHAADLARMASSARAFAREGRAAVATLDVPGQAGEPAVKSALGAGHRFEDSLDAYPVRWVDRLAYEPLFWVVLVAGFVVSALVVAHAAVWTFGNVSTWAERDRRRIHARLFWRTLLTDGFIAALLVLVVATHSINNGASVMAVSVLAAVVLAAAVIAEQRSQQVIEVLKGRDRVPVRTEVPPPAPAAWAPPQIAIRTHVLSTMPPLATASHDDSDVLLVGNGLQADVSESGTLRVAAKPVPRQ
jgi:hypothetical protein